MIISWGKRLNINLSHLNELTGHTRAKLGPHRRCYLLYNVSIFSAMKNVGNVKCYTCNPQGSNDLRASKSQI